MKIVVVGGGFAGVKTAVELSNRPNIQVTLISQGENFEYHGALYRSGTGRSPLEVVLPLRTIFNDSTNVEVVLDKIVGLDIQKQRAVSETGNLYAYDKLVLAMGNIPNYFGIEGMAVNSMTLDTIANTIRLRHRLTELFKSEHTVKVAIIGAGASGVELAGEMQHFARLVAERYGKKPAKVEVRLIEAADRVLPTLKPRASRKAEKRLKNLHVALLLKTTVQACKPGQLELSSGNLEADIIIWTAGTRAVGFYAEHEDWFQLERDKVRVDHYLKAVGQQAIYVLGDNAATPYSGMAQTALHDAKFVAKNMLRELKGKSPVTYRVLHPIYVVPIGPRWAVLQTDKQIISGYRGWLVRRRADLAIYRNFEPYKLALKTWRKGNRLARF